MPKDVIWTWGKAQLELTEMLHPPKKSSRCTVIYKHDELSLFLRGKSVSLGCHDNNPPRLVTEYVKCSRPRQE